MSVTALLLQSDDLRLLAEEVKVAQQQLERATQLREECVRLQQYGHHNHRKELTTSEGMSIEDSSPCLSTCAAYSGRKTSSPKRPRRRKMRYVSKLYLYSCNTVHVPEEKWINIYVCVCVLQVTGSHNFLQEVFTLSPQSLLYD